MQYGKLIVIGDAPRNKHGQRVLQCRCECGKEVAVVEQSLKCGNTKSCGCHRVFIGSTNNLKHGATRSRAYLSWWNMKSRCERPNSKYFSDYGGRGIKVCDRWQKFENFLADMGQPPEGQTLERIDNNIGYSPENVRWADRQQQANNRRSNRLIEHGGRTLTLQQWAKETGIKRATIAYRIDHGWSPEMALKS